MTGGEREVAPQLLLLLLVPFERGDGITGFLLYGLALAEGECGLRALALPLRPDG